VITKVGRSKTHLAYLTRKSFFQDTALFHYQYFDTLSLQYGPSFIRSSASPQQATRRTDSLRIEKGEMGDEAEKKAITLSEGETKLFISIMKNLESDIAVRQAINPLLYHERTLTVSASSTPTPLLPNAATNLLRSSRTAGLK
jgi:hypothetical protein